MLALGKVVRTTAFKLSAIYIAVFSAFAVAFVLYISYSANQLLTQQVHDTIAAEIQGLAEQGRSGGLRAIVVSTQGKGDEAALAAALVIEADYVAFVGSHKKAATLKAKMTERGLDPERIAGIHSPAGLDLGAITPEEIALSILAEIVMLRRKGQRPDPATTATGAAVPA